jgi:hypothetical protein
MKSGSGTKASFQWLCRELQKLTKFLLIDSVDFVGDLYAIVFISLVVARICSRLLGLGPQDLRGRQLFSFLLAALLLLNASVCDVNSALPIIFQRPLCLLAFLQEVSEPVEYSNYHLQMIRGSFFGKLIVVLGCFFINARRRVLKFYIFEAKGSDL